MWAKFSVDENAPLVVCREIAINIPWKMNFVNQCPNVCVNHISRRPESKRLKISAGLLILFFYFHDRTCGDQNRSYGLTIPISPKSAADDK